MSDDLQSLLKQAIEQGLTAALSEKLGNAIESSPVSVSRKDFLAMKHGNISAAQRIFRCINGCACGLVFEEEPLRTVSDYDACVNAVDKAIGSGKLVDVNQPVWSDQSKYELNPTCFYKCVSCGLYWQLSKPERSHEGVWKTA